MSSNSNRGWSVGRLFNYANNPITILGIVLTTVSGLGIVTFVITQLYGGIRNPYTSIFSFIILPSIFVAGLVLIPLGMWRRSRKLRRDGVSDEELDRFPRLDFNSPQIRRLGLTVLGLTAVNLVLLGFSSYYAVDEMDTASFCGETCHYLMQPEYTAYKGSPHSHVACVECHIGPGASWFVKSKLDGLRQVWKTVWDTYERPIKTPVVTLRPARQTCEQCHWPAKHYGDKMNVFARFSTDEANTPSFNVMLIKTGGGSLDLGRQGGIHWWHIYSDNKIRYVSDAARQKMYWVELTTPDGKTKVFTRGDDTVPNEATIESDARVMDCIDCHNRPTHLFEVPSKALDTVLSNHADYRALPYYKKQALEAIKGDYGTHDGGMEAVTEKVIAYYQANHLELWQAKQDLVTRAAKAAADIYGRTVFPAMKTNWETHPDNIGHDDFPGCWRCHDGEMSTADGNDTIPIDCDTCHVFLVEDSPTEPDIADLTMPQKSSS